MNEGFSTEAVLSFLRRNLFLSGITATGLLLILFGFFGMGMIQPQKESVVYESGSGVEGTSVEGDSGQARMTDKLDDAKKTIFVDIAGSVEKPGVYELPATARVQDVLSEAGGLTAKADAQGIAKTVNLASKVADGMKLYFPFKGETQILGISQIEGTPLRQGFEGQAGVGSTQTNGLINLNLASQSELESLPGIGEVTAQKIIKGRPYGSVQDVKDKKVVGESVYGKIKDLVTVN